MMNEKEIINTGKTFFWLSFFLGNVCLFGYLLSKNDQFAFGGFLVLIFGTLINFLIVLGLLIYGSIYKSKLKFCIRASLIMCINIPFAILYYFIGASLLNF